MKEIAIFANNFIVDLCQILAIVVIGIGIMKALLIYIKDSLFGRDSSKAIKESRLELGHSFSLGLGFLIGASILKTTLAPSWNDIGQLASIIFIRTVLNFFLQLEIVRHSDSQKEKKQVASEKK